MKYIHLGMTAVPAIGLGTYKLLGSKAIDIISNAIGAGYRHIDTAQLYDNEREVGQAIQISGVPRNEIYIVTKVWPSNLHDDRFIPSVEESLRKLKTDRVDLLLIHWPHQSLPVEEYMQTLMKVQQSGMAVDIGVSNFNIAQMTAAMETGARIVCNQVEYHPWINQTRLMDWMLSRQIALIAYCPLAQGRFVNEKKLESIAADHLRSPAQIILRWMMQKEKVLAIPRSSNIHRVINNLNVFDFELSAKEVEIMDAWRLENIRVVGLQAGAKWD